MRHGAWLLHALLAVAEKTPTSGRLHVGQHSFCSGNSRHLVSYNTKLTSSAEVIELDDLNELESIQCDVDGSRLRVSFHNHLKSLALWGQIKLGNVYVTGGINHGCPLQVDPSKGFLLRRVNGAFLDGRSVVMDTSLARYDEIYESASIFYSSEQTSECSRLSIEKEICVGANTGENCTGPDKTIPIMDNSHITVECSQCWGTLKMDVFFNLKIENFKLVSMQAGYKNASIVSMAELRTSAKRDWSVAIEKDLLFDGITETPILDFKVGPVPFVFWFDSSLHLSAMSSIMGLQGNEVRTGAKLTLDFMDNWVSWDPVWHWNHILPNATTKLSIEPIFKGNTTLEGSAEIQLKPSIKLHVNELFSYTMSFDPKVSLDFTAQWDGSDKLKFCEEGAHEFSLVAECELKLNVDWAHIKEDKRWGPINLLSHKENFNKSCQQVPVPPMAEEQVIALV